MYVFDPFWSIQTRGRGWKKLTIENYHQGRVDFFNILVWTRLHTAPLEMQKALDAGSANLSHLFKWYTCKCAELLNFHLLCMQFFSWPIIYLCIILFCFACMPPFPNYYHLEFGKPTVCTKFTQLLEYFLDRRIDWILSC